MSWGAEDIRNLTAAFAEKYGTDCIIDTLFDEDVTTKNVAAIKSRLAHTILMVSNIHSCLQQDTNAC